MATPLEAARAFRRRLAGAAKTFRSPSPVRLLEKIRAPLTRGGDTLGTLEVLMRVTLGTDESVGIVVFEWPDAAGDHAVVAAVERGFAVAASGPRGSLTIEERRTTTGTATHKKLRFPLANAGDELDELLAFVVRVGLGSRLCAQLPGASPESRAVRSTPKVAAEPSVDPERVDRIVHGAEFDAARHPQVEINRQVTNSAGVTFRLVSKRVGAARRRVWTKVPRSATG